MKWIFIFFVFILASDVHGQTGNIKDSFKINNSPDINPAFINNNWIKDDWDGTLTLMQRRIPHATGYRFPFLLFFTDKAFRNYYKDSLFAIDKDIFFIDNVIYEDTTINRKFFTNYYLPNTISEFIFPESEKDQKEITLKKRFFIKNADTKTSVSLESITAKNGSINFISNTLPKLTLNKIKTNILSFISNNLKMTYLNNCEIDELSFMGDSLANATKEDSLLIVDIANLYDSTDISSYLLNNFFSLSITNSVLQKASFLGIKSPFILANFKSCKISGIMDFQDEVLYNLEIPEEHLISNAYKIYNKLDSLKQEDSKKYDITFTESFVDGSITNIRGVAKFNFTFDKCQFGDNASLSDLNFDTLIIKNCTKILTTLFLNISSKQKTYLSILNSDLSRIQFEYTDSMTFLPDPEGNSTYDNINNAYLMLLDKFKLEGRSKSFQKLDIEHKQWYYSEKGLWGKFQNTIDRYWWHYGYRKHYVLFWSLAFLVLFAIINFRLWKSLSQIYPVINNKKSSYFERIHSKNLTLLKSLHVIIVTFFIFFSFRLEFNKINYQNPKVLFYFFFQYLIGLICLFFIVNFILKF